MSRLLTDHGPWEGYNVTRHEVDPVPDDRAHPLADPRPARDRSDHMKRYLDSKGLAATVSTRSSSPARRPTSSPGDPGLRLGRQGELRSGRREGGDAFHVEERPADKAGIAFVPARPRE